MRPFYLDGKVVGLLCRAHCGGPRLWTENEKTIAANLADYVQILWLTNQRHQAEEALRVNQRVLAHAQKMEALGRLSCGIAHDFNNFLQVISGNGMPIEVQTRAMEPFFTTKGTDKGTGLGLWNVYNFMRRCHGHVVIDSEPDRGTAIHLYLPTVTVPPPALREEAPANTTPLSPVMLDEAVQRTVADMLGFLGHQVTVCGEGARAVEVFLAGPSAIDLVLIDLNMAGMPGNDCLRALRAIDPSCRCLVMSGNLNNEIAHDCLQKGALGILAKPFSLTACAQAVEKALATSRQARSPLD